MGRWGLVDYLWGLWLEHGITVSFSWSFAATGDREKSRMKYPTQKDFLVAIEPFARQIESGYKIPWLFAATQAAHESGNGNSLLTVEANNLFGITGDGWQVQGKPVYIIQTKEYNAAHEPYMVKRPFRKYPSWQESLEDWAALIQRRYPYAYNAALADDFSSFAAALQSGGYATDPDYAVELIARYHQLRSYCLPIPGVDPPEPTPQASVPPELPPSEAPPKTA